MTQTTPTHFADRLLAACQEKASPICVGIDPVYERLPASLRGTSENKEVVNAHERVDAIMEYVRGVLVSVKAHVPCVKIQSACFERYLELGVQAYHELTEEAQQMGLLVIGDAKRGDIGISAEHYAAGCLAPTDYADLGYFAGPDALTVNAYMGMDTLEPFIKAAKTHGKGLFALVRTSNPGSDGIQNMKLSDGNTIAEHVAKLITKTGSGEGCVGASGLSLLGAVVGATKAADVVSLRKLMPQQIFLVPGFGAQGGTADDVKACFLSGGRGAIITASRSILYAYEKPATEDWKGAIEKATVDMKREIAGILG